MEKLNNSIFFSKFIYGYENLGMAYKCYLCKRKARIMYDVSKVNNKMKLICKSCQEKEGFDTTDVLEIDTLMLQELHIKRLLRKLEQATKFADSIRKVDYD